jgi:nicotinamidase-related amidase
VPVTELDPRTALVVVDLQKGVVTLPTAEPPAAITERAATLAAAFRKRGLPVVLVTATAGAPGRTERPRSLAGRPADWTELVPELDRQPEDLTVTKGTWGAFHGTTLHEQLTRLGVTQVVVVGIATSKGVESTARAAYEHGYNVTLAVDAMTDMDPGAHENSVTRIFPALGETGRTADILALLERSTL